jgi:hypothetical protein
MSHEEELLEHPPAMAEMAGAAIENEVHAHVEHMEPEDVPAGLAALEAETEA